ncbi:MAG: hypothetical protein FJ267_15445, partial [Planctomycetes bacterium]|nr:hypothetical protein [Planctomycetota bacterium]
MRSMSGLKDWSRSIRLIVAIAIAAVLLTESCVAFAQETPPDQPQQFDGKQGGGLGGGRSGRRRGGFFGRDNVSLMFALRDEAFAEKIALTEEQKKKFEELRMEIFAAFRSVQSREEMPNMMKEFEQKAVDILNEQQKTIWASRKEELEKELKERKERDAAIEAERANQKSENSDSANSTPPSETPPVRVPRMTLVEEKVPEGAKVTASFGRRSSESGEESEAASGASTTERSDEPKLEFNFRYAAWADVLKLFAEVAGLTLDLNDVPPGTFNYYDEKSYTVTEALDVLNGYLLPKGFALIRRDRFLVSLNLDNGIPPSMIPNVPLEQISERGANELISVVMPIDGLEADKVATEVKELLGPMQKVSAIKSTNSLVIVDTAGNIARVHRLLKTGSLID